LARIGCGEADLVCGPHPPAAEGAANDLVRGGQAPSRLHNNCSGKHAGFLAACRSEGFPAEGYERAGHPLQVAVRRVLAEMGDAAIAAEEGAVDGCGVPTHPMPLAALATAYARLAAPGGLGPRRAAAVRRITGAMTAHPLLVSGSGGFDSRIIAAAAGGVICKTGAEGVHAAALPAEGLGIAVKIDDGGKRAAESAIAALIARFAQLPSPVTAMLAEAARYPLINTLGAAVGEVRPAAGWPD
jgi:L-asparaginase II